MTISHHAGKRMNQRGIPRRLVDFALRHGRIEGDRHVLDRHETRRLLDALREDVRLALHVLDKGGITVVEDAGTVVTTYNVVPGAQKPKRKHAETMPQTLTAPEFVVNHVESQPEAAG